MILKKGIQTKRFNSGSVSFIKGLKACGWVEVQEDSVSIEKINEDVEDIIKSIENKEEDTQEEEVKEVSIEELRKTYKEQLGKEVSNKFKNNFEWIKSKIK